ncbi:MAG TPA: HNH endonuclease [Bosea sp. (in: a-proteobacteria)]|uniref:HNH endonuclease n=1 Tax=Bosea sp. (in: a-proteobacteria) TaxID=1871050 RepID=UPI002DDD9332|nr:HNH endonuclease [Bosea sp. (in: a-proteobacteria)]HEV2555455.1 HNH endonuclease [Bosea sp. (in: a-proteobacteria)]
MVPFSKKYPRAVHLLLEANVFPDGGNDVRCVYAALAKHLGIDIPEGEFGSCANAKLALRDFQMTGVLPCIPTAAKRIPTPAARPTKMPVDRPRPSSCDKLLWHFGVSSRRQDPDYNRKLIETCQAEYRKRFGSERTKLKPASARAILALMRAGAPVASPDVADARLGKKRKVSKPRLEPKPGSLTQAQIEFIVGSAFLESYEWRKARYQALKVSSGCCCLCGRERPHSAVLNVDHIKPRRRFPELALTPSNLQVLCGECNHGKGNWDETDWR